MKRPGSRTLGRVLVVAALGLALATAVAAAPRRASRRRSDRGLPAQEVGALAGSGGRRVLPAQRSRRSRGAPAASADRKGRQGRRATRATPGFRARAARAARRVPRVRWVRPARPVPPVRQALRGLRAPLAQPVPQALRVQQARASRRSGSSRDRLHAGGRRAGSVRRDGRATVRSRSRATRAARRLRAPPPDGSIVINEIDYDQVGADSSGFVELREQRHLGGHLGGLALVLVDGTDGLEYDHEPDRKLAAGGVPVRRDGGPERRAGRGRARRHRHGYAARRALLRGAITRPIGPRRLQPRRGHGAADERGRLEHGHRLADPLPDGSDTNNAATDWLFTTT